MRSAKTTFFSHPTKKVMWLVFLIWLIGNFLTVLAITDFFKESLFQKGALPLYFLMAASTAVLVEMCVKYFRPNKVS